MTSGTHGIVTVVTANSSYVGMVAAFFEWTNNMSATSLTQIASSGSATQPGISTTNVGTGTIPISLQYSGTSIQVKTTASFNVKWYVTLL